MKLFVVMLVLQLLLLSVAKGDNLPQEIHLSLTGNPDEMYVVWMTASDTQSSQAIYWNTNNPSVNYTATGSISHYYEPVPPYMSPAIHYVKMTGLQPQSIYNYVVGSPDGGYSKVQYFHTKGGKTAPMAGTPTVTFISIGDHGTTSNSLQVVNSMIQLEKQGYAWDLLVHAGDISYANGIQKYWDTWGTLVEPIAAHVPWMVAVGNHEILDLFLAYLYRFQMPAKESSAPQGNLFYSFNYENVHFIAVSSEALEYWHFDSQYAWLEKDLSRVNRSVTPWIVATWHTPWYCSNTNHYDAGADMRDSYEDLFYKYKVDLILNGHVHAYERTLPMYKGQVTPDGPMYVTNGVGGNAEGLYRHWRDPQPDWSQFRDAFFGYGAVQVFNTTHLYWQMVRSNDSAIVDDYWLVRQR